MCVAATLPLLAALVIVLVGNILFLDAGGLKKADVERTSLRPDHLRHWRPVIPGDSSSGHTTGSGFRCLQAASGRTLHGANVSAKVLSLF